ncbi:hypothetical protein P5673_029871 [Acropora cervicornis]|uniref:Uncharacterized protein n=1 Tax=Acropora cervicornis TaxID=6130 RepID=A0AAD9PVG3_ACRCE|nr:hypothetical protein P5673_029871 [Acropora cervicornis]
MQIQRSEDQHHGYFEVFLNHSLNVSPILSTISVSRYIQCAFSCLQNVLCFSFNVATVQDINSKQYACQLLPTDKCRNPDDFVLSQEFHHYTTPRLHHAKKEHVGPLIIKRDSVPMEALEEAVTQKVLTNFCAFKEAFRGTFTIIVPKLLEKQEYITFWTNNRKHFQFRVIELRVMDTFLKRMNLADVAQQPSKFINSKLW